MRNIAAEVEKAFMTLQHPKPEAYEERVISVEYRVLPVVRYIVTEWHQKETYYPEKDVWIQGTGGGMVNEFASLQTAHNVATALCRVEHLKSGEPEDSEKFIYPAPLEYAE